MLTGVDALVEDGVVEDHVAGVVDGLVSCTENSQMLESVARVLVLELIAGVPSHDWVEDIALEELEWCWPESLVGPLGDGSESEDSTNVKCLRQWETEVSVAHIDIVQALPVSICCTVEAYGVSAVFHGERKARGVIGTVESCFVESGVLESR